MRHKIILFSLLTLLSLDTLSTYAQDTLHMEGRGEYVKAINDLFKDKSWDSGKKLLDEASAKYTKDSDLRMLLGKYHFEKKNYDLARFELLEALKYNKQNTEAKQILINVEIETKRYSSATCYINELLEVNPYWKGLWLKQIEVYKLQGNVVESNRMLKRLSQIYPEDASLRTRYQQLLEEEATDNAKKGLYDESIKLSKELLSGNPTDPHIYLSLINNSLKTGEYENALVYAERGLYNIPDNLDLMNKKTDILASLGRYDDALVYWIGLSKFIDTHSYNKKYTYLVELAANYYSKSDPYSLNKILFFQQPSNMDAFNYVYNKALADGLYDEALDFVKMAIKKNGEGKSLLVKEQMIYKKMGAQSKANQLTVYLFGLYPTDTDIQQEYASLKAKEAKLYTSEGLYNKAIELWNEVLKYGDADLTLDASASLTNCLYQAQRYDEALDVINNLSNSQPDEELWRAKTAEIYGMRKEYAKSLAEYEKIVNLSTTENKQRVLNGYNELAVKYTKQLIEEYRFDEAKSIINKWLDIYPSSEQAIKYAINVADQTQNDEDFLKYALQGVSFHPQNEFFTIKLAEVSGVKKEYRKSVDMLLPEVKKNPHHKDLINAFSQISEEYSEELIKDSKPKEALVLLEDAISFDPDNKMLKYNKGLALEKEHRYDSAYHYQSFYEPSLVELSDYTKHMNALKLKTFKNEIGFIYLRSELSGVITSYATIEYSRFAQKNTYTGRVNYSGREDSRGIQGQFEWGRYWNNGYSTTMNMALGNETFPKIALNASIFKEFANGWEAELGAGYRKTSDKKNVYNVTLGASRIYDPWWLNGKISPVVYKNKLLYNMLVQSRYILGDIPSNYITAMAGIGSAPEVDAMDNNLYDSFDVTNVMFGFGFRHIISSGLTGGILANWYNFEDTRIGYEGSKRNLYNLYFQLHVRF